jgi:arylsulfatase A-like enzyme
LITVDTLRADRLGCYGYFRNTTPVIDELAKRSVLFENVVTQMGCTLPAHVSLLTSTRTIRHGVQNNAMLFDAEALGLRTFPQMLQDAGYRTAAFVSAAPLKDLTGISTGFAHFSQPEERSRPADAVTEDVLAWLETPPSEPILLWIHYFDPHFLYRPPPPFNQAFKTNERLLRYLEHGAFTNWEDRAVQYSHNQYDGEILFVDGQIGRLFERLRELDLFDEAVIVFTSDHGEGLGQHDWMQHGQLHAEILQVPLILKLPGMGSEEAERRADLAALVDVLPILTEELELPVSASDRAQFEGMNPLSDPTREYVLSERMTAPSGNLFRRGEEYAITGRRWRYYYASEKDDRLFDLRTDPLELRNVIGEYPAVVTLMKERLDDLLTAALGLPGAPSDRDLPPEFIAELRALGYVD